MASLRRINERGRNGWLIRFYLEKKRRTITISDIDENAANTWLNHVEHLAASYGKTSPSKATTAWVHSLSQSHLEKLAKVGLIERPADEVEEEPKAAPLLGDYLDTYFDSIKTEIKPATWTFYQHTRKRLVEYFAGREIASITPIEAKQFRTWLETQSNRRNKPDEQGNAVPLAVNTVRRRIGVCKQVFSRAVEDGLIERNPFKGMASTVRSNKQRQEYVPLETFAKVLAKAPNARWRALLVLARVACLRIPSEVCQLKWSDIAWDQKRMTIRSPKTEHHAGHESRVIPLFESVEVELLKLFAEPATSPDDRVFPDIAADSNLRTTLEKIIRRAGVKQWPKLWQNLRASGASDMAMEYPSHVATAICGHTEEVAREHYWTVSESDFDSILAAGKIGAPIGAPIEWQPGAAGGNTGKTQGDGKSDKTQGKQAKKEPMAATGSHGQQLDFDNEWARRDSNSCEKQGKNSELPAALPLALPFGLLLVDQAGNIASRLDDLPSLKAALAMAASLQAQGLFPVIVPPDDALGLKPAELSGKSANPSS